MAQKFSTAYDVFLVIAGRVDWGWGCAYGCTDEAEMITADVVVWVPEKRLLR